MPSDLHFLAPQWFLALLPLAAILWGLGRGGTGSGAWQRIVDPNLLPHLLVPGGGRGRRLPLYLLALGWLGTLLALANPTFERLPAPAYRGELSRIVLLDLSQSMQSADLEPSRLARARYKVADILERSRDGQVGLVAFAGDAFVVSPLSNDADTIQSMLEAVVPEIMPVPGSRPDLAIAKAAELLTQAGATTGEVVLVGDAPGDARALAQARSLATAGHRLSVIGVGTAEGAPVPGIRDQDQRPVISVLDTDAMRTLARAGGGRYAPLSADGRDLEQTLGARVPTVPDRTDEEAQMQTEVWDELGPWVLLAILPLAALAFRRGWLLTVALVMTSMTWHPAPAMAFGWNDLWQRRDQQAATALERGEHQRALELAEQPQRRGTASYRLGDYEAAATAFAAEDRADGHYNRGNALAKSGRLQEAIAAYEQALSKAPEMQDAAYNKALLEELLKQQQAQSQGEEQQGQDDEQPRDRDSKDPAAGEDPSQQREQSADEDQGDGEQQDGQNQDQQAEQQAQHPDAADQQSPQRVQHPGDESADGADERSQTGDDQADKHKENTDTSEPRDRDQEERTAADYREQAAQHRDGEPQEAADTSAPRPDTQEPSAQEREERQAADQWLRRIPDDPAGLLRRKFRYQYRSRAARDGAASPGDPW